MAPRPRFHKLSPDKRRRILTAASTEFAEHGFDGASLNRIIDAAEISKGAMYYYFDDKLDLYATVAEHHARAMVGDPPDWSALSTPAAYWATIRELFERSFASAFEAPEGFMFFRSMLRLTPEQRQSKPLAELEGGFREIVAQAVHQGQACGAVRTDLPQELILRMVWAVDEVLDFWTMEHMEDLGYGRPEHAAATSGAPDTGADAHLGGADSAHDMLSHATDLYLNTTMRVLCPAPALAQLCSLLETP